MINSSTNNQDFKTETYKSLLKSYIIEGQLPFQQLQIELEKYIAVFSLYLQNTNDAYKYNLPYLSYQNKRFSSFLISASEKNEKLRNIVAHVKKTFASKKTINEDFKSIAVKNVKISLNDFLTADLSGKIGFHKLFSLSGAERTSKNDIITIEYKQQVRTVKIPKSSELEFGRVVDIVETMLNNSLGTGGNQ